MNESLLNTGDTPRTTRKIILIAAALLRRGLRKQLKAEGKTFENVYDMQFYADPTLHRVSKYGIYGWAQCGRRDFRVAIDWPIRWGFKPSDVFDILDKWLEKQTFDDRLQNNCRRQETEQ